MKPFDPRLLKYAKAARRYIVEIAALGLITAALVIAQAFLISYALTPVVTRSAPLESVLPFVGALLLVVLARAAMVYLREARAHRAADDAVAQLREAVVHKAVRLGPRWRARNGSETTTLVTRGLDDLDPYFVKFLPQLLLVVTVTPLTLLVILFLDFWSALIALITIPLIPIFMVLIGRLTQGFSEKKLIAMERLGSQLLDLLTGLPTLRALGRERGPRKHLQRLSRQNTKTTMQTLQVAFLSGGVLEFIATLSVALVAVEVGMRMVSGQLGLFVGLVIIMLAPEVFDPLRQVGTQFHASTNGVAAADACFAVLETPEATPGTAVPAPAGSTPIIIEDLFVAARGNWAPAALTGTIEPGLITALVGPSGAGKSTTVQVLLNFESATRGAISANDKEGLSRPISEFDCDLWWEGISWIPQHPHFEPGTLLEAVLAGTTLGETEETRATVSAAAAQTGLDEVVATLPDGWDTPIGTGGVGLSLGQRQRVALTRVLIASPSLLVLDEPTAHLDAVSEEQVVQVLSQIRANGTTVVVIAHRAAVIAAADRVLEVFSQPATAADLEKYPSLGDDFELEDLSGEMPSFLDPSAIDTLATTQSARDAVVVAAEGGLSESPQDNSCGASGDDSFGERGGDRA